MATVTYSLLKQAASAGGKLTPGLCSRWVETLDSFAPWVLRPEVLQKSLEDKRLAPDLRDPLDRFLRNRRAPAQPGACNVIFVTDDTLRGEMSLLRNSFILPLQWKRGLPHSNALPPNLASLADQVRADLGSAVKSQWGLALNDFAGLSDLELSGLPLRCDSAWGALAAGLLLADVGGRPKEDVFVSAEWKPGLGIQDVGDVKEKVSAAKEFGCRLFYASSPKAQAERFSQEGGTHADVDVRDLRWGEKDPTVALQDLLHELEFPPHRRDGSTFEECCRYADGFPNAQRDAREDYIVVDVLREHATRLRETWASRIKVDRLAVLMSSRSAALLSLLVLRPKRALVVHTERDLKQYEAVEALAGTFDEIKDCCVPCLVGVCDFTTIEAEILKFLSAGQGASAVDVTGGTSGMTAAATFGAIRANASLFHVLSKTKGYMAMAGTGEMKFVRGPVGAE